ncbi:hypothetical protein ABIA32_000295 [Streptacidiphilus sp. MAP12-20]|uniref:hypothetical protein n=1 Tax=Streptacidiphilus sp. MAP12-20 TaxID=3156299 RepID=UPI00351152B4
MGAVPYDTYARQLGQLVTEASSGRWERLADDVHAALNGQAASQLRSLVPRQVRRETGSFFTTGPVRNSFEHLLPPVPAQADAPTYWDPTCGAGDLLLAATAKLPLAATPARSLALWNRRLRGHDLQESYVTAARMRLVLALLERHRLAGSDEPLAADRVAGALPLLQVGDGLQQLHSLGRPARFGGSLLLNPPYGMAEAGPACTWSSGSTSLAATFTAAAAAALRDGSRLTAVLPDVLRSGSRYRAWREQLTGLLDVHEVKPHGMFDIHTDVDVFLLSAVRRRGGPVRSFSWWPEPEAAEGQTLNDLFEVRVGPVVDNRDPRTGPEAPYLTARDLPAGGEMGLPQRTRNYPKRLIAPPFVVLRRTSRPGQGSKGASRGAGVLVVGDRPVAVDNHLIVASPRAAGVDRCRALLKVLEQPEIALWLDERIRCRHLTVTAVRDLPWNGTDHLASMSSPPPHAKAQ